MIEFLFLIAEFVGQTANRALRTNAVDHVTDLKTKMRIREKRHTGTEDTCDIDTVVAA